jgi:hypothetical protein
MRIDITLLIAVLVVLKVLGVINWSWWIVLFPLVIVGGFLIFVTGLLFLALLLSIILGTPLKITQENKKK